MKRLLVFIIILLTGCTRFALEAKRLPSPPPPVPPVEPFMIQRAENDKRCVQWVDSVFNKMSLKERIGQLLIYTIAPQKTKKNRKLLRKVVEEYKVGGLLFSGGLMLNQAMLTNEAQRMAKVPLMITFDGEWGLSMRLRGTPVFPKNMVLGCVQDDKLIYAYGREMARQCRELGIRVNFAPVADVNINPRNPVINTRSFGESPVSVADKVISYAKGLEDGGVLSVCKHFPGHGDTDVDSHKALPTLPFTRERLDSIELYPFKKAIKAGLSGIMVGHLEVPIFEEHVGLPSSLSRNVVYDLLSRELHFKGLIFTDALSMKGVSGNEMVCLKALKAGNDMLLVPDRLKEEVQSVVDAIKSGDMEEEDINRRCRKVLTYKYVLGLRKRPQIHLSGLGSRVNTPHTKDLIRRLNLAAVTVLGNQQGILPLSTDIKQLAVLNVGDNKIIKPFFKELSEYTHPVGFQLGKSLSEAERINLKEMLSHYKRIIVCVTDHRLAPYQTFFADFAPKVPVVYVFFIPGKQILQIHRGVSAADAVVLAHSPGEDIQKYVAKVLYANATANGRLSASIGGLFATGDGMTLSPETPHRFIPEEYGMNSRLLSRIDTIATEGIRKGAYPGCQIAIFKNGKELYNKAFGTHTWAKGSVAASAGASALMLDVPVPVKKTDVYDLASLTKTTATLLAVMKLYDKGALSLTDRASDYLSYLKNTDKKNITVRELLLHESGLPPTLLFYQDVIDKKSYKGSLFKAKRDKLYSVRVGAEVWANPNFRFRKGLTSTIRMAGYSMQVCDSLWLNDSFKKEYLKKIANAPLKDKRYRYSDINFILLQQIVEQCTGMPLNKFLEREFYVPMGLSRTGYLPLSHQYGSFKKGLKSEIVPSNIDLFLRKELLQGFVHDEAAAFQGGVSGNAGLFSNATEVASIYQMLLNNGEWRGKRYLSETTCRMFTTTISNISRRGLGFDKPDTRHPENSPCCISASASVYGHTGFTGTCAWVDPVNALVYVFLSNRIYPDAWNTKLQKLKIRERIQEAMYQALSSPEAKK